jgi:hypothetical protein
MQGSQGSGCYRCRRGELRQKVGDVDVYGISWSKQRERDEFLNQGGVIDPERRSRETARSTATSTLAGGDLLE